MADIDFFNKMAPSWDETNSSLNLPAIKKIFRLSGITKGMDILDVGTGTGVLLPLLADTVGNKGSIMAVDIAEKMLAEAVKKARTLDPHPVFLLANVETDAIPCRFDRIIFYCVFPHIHNPEETLRKLVDNNLKHGGKIVIAHPTGSANINRMHGRRPIQSELLPSGAELKRRVEAAGMHAEVLADTDELYLVTIEA